MAADGLKGVAVVVEELGVASVGYTVDMQNKVSSPEGKQVVWHSHTSTGTGEEGHCYIVTGRGWRGRVDTAKERCTAGIDWDRVVDNSSP